ncbi:serine/threonine-protein kinase PLK1-like [Rana temporaria]|uniref:serine/threonine-protein kinase PLK1-like n=1 Tax=Rana temporaria TaxID=8407 RepID=UPI001AADECC7|nr:serine/threonine-protein kinase PLK1-like [Rana temporaria]
MDFTTLPAAAEIGYNPPLVEKNVAPAKDEDMASPECTEPADCYLSDMMQQLTSVNAAMPSKKDVILQEQAEDPACNPIFWISKWMDYSAKYGLGYQLCDNSVGVLFNDSTWLIMYNDGVSLQYIERNNTESHHDVRSYPSSLTKKVTLLKFFKNYMNDHLLKAGANISPREGDKKAQVPFLRTWFSTRRAIALHLSNGTVQINFFQDHTKIILCPLMAAVSYFDEQQNFHTYKLSLIEEFGCSKDLARRLHYARSIVEKLQSSKSGARHKKAPA